MTFLLKRIFRIKSITSILAENKRNKQQKLKKVLGPIDLILLGIGVIIGAGIFAMVGTATAGDALRPGAGPALIVSFALTALVCGLAALCYAELASLVPISGSAYTYSYATFGELIAWIIGWDLMLEYCVGSIAVAISWSGYFKALLASVGFILPAWMTMDIRSALQHAPQVVQAAPHIFGIPIILNIPAILIVLLLMTLLVIGIKESARFNTTIVIIKLLVLGFFISVGAFFIKPENWLPFAPNGFAGIKAGAAIAFFAYIGFDVLSTTSEETKNPARDLPIGIIGSLIICAIIYMAVAAVFSGIVPYSLLSGSLAQQKAEPLALAMQLIHLPWAVGIIAIGSVVAQMAVLLALQLGQSRIFFSMSRDGLLPKIFSKVHTKFKTPYVSTLILGLATAAVAGFTNIDEMVDLTNIGTLFAFVLVCLGVVILRYKEPNHKRAFRVPWSPVLPILGALSCFFLMTGLPAITWIRFIVWLILGLIVYFSYGFKHSVLNKK